VQIIQLQLALDHFLATRPYYPCCLLVHPDVRQLQKAAKQIIIWRHWTDLSIGAELSATLLSVAPQQRARAAHAALFEIVRLLAPGPLLCTDIDLLFEPSLALDPLRLLRDTSRLATLIVLWPGTASGGTLAYAVPSHTHYRSWSRIDLPTESVISL
jgi:hypothetical protein